VRAAKIRFFYANATAFIILKEYGVSATHRETASQKYKSGCAGAAGAFIILNGTMYLLRIGRLPPKNIKAAAPAPQALL
jgi:hypothetical protein